MNSASVQGQIKAALQRLPLLHEMEGRLERITQMLALMTNKNSKAGRVPTEFRDAARSTCVKELQRLSRQARRTAELTSSRHDANKLARAGKRLAATLDELHQPTILALADVGFLGGERLELQNLARRIAEATGRRSKEDLRLLRWTVDCASRADVRKIKEDQRKGRPINKRAQVLTRILYGEYEALTGRRPTITVNPIRDNSPASGPFLRLVRDVFSALTISASAEAAVRAELHARRAGAANERITVK